MALGGAISKLLYFDSGFEKTDYNTVGWSVVKIYKLKTDAAPNNRNDKMLTWMYGMGVVTRISRRKRIHKVLCRILY